jgi:hypothetical protein
MFTRIALSALAIVAACAAARPVAAQSAVQSDVRRPDVAAAAAVRPLAMYRFVATSADMPAQVTVADSAGHLVGSYRLPGESEARPMMVTTINSDIVLQGESPSGLLTIVLDRQNAPTASGKSFSGRWILGGLQGDLRGRVNE